MPITPRIRRMIIEERPVDEIREAAREEGMRTLREDGVAKALRGITTLEEVLEATAM